MKLLAIDTATEACSAALRIDDEIIEKYQLAPRQHTMLILPMIDQLLSEAELQPQQLDGLAFGCGPGSFTGVRIASGVIQGIALGAELPVVAISTLASLAQQGFDRSDATLAFAAMDARMQEVYWGVYQRNQQGLAVLQGQEIVGLAKHIEYPDVNGIAVGSAWQVYQTEMLAQVQNKVDNIYAEILPRASAIAKLALTENQQWVTAEQAMPVYLRNNVAKKSSKA